MTEEQTKDPLATRASLLDQVRNPHNQESWREFYNLYSGLVHRLALRHGLNEAEARDVVQETFIAVVKALPGFHYDPAIGSFRGWMMRLSQWRIYDHFRKRGPFQGRPPGHAATDSPTTGTLERIPDESPNNLQALWDREWHQSVMATALQRVKNLISSRQFQIFDLYVLKDWPVLKVARALNVSVGQVYLSKHRIAKLIKDEIKRVEAQFN